VNVVPLAFHSPRAVRDALTAHGWEQGQAEAAAGGVAPLAFHLIELDQGTLEALVRFAGRLGLEVLTGDSWAILSGSRSRLSAFARPWTVPEPLREVAVQVGLAMPAEGPAVWLTARGAIPVDRPVIMGVLNVTPDSFSDGGQFVAHDAALAQADRLIEAGATVIDVGGESTRPGRAEGVAEDEERRRVVPIIEALVHRHPDLCISIDTVKSTVARSALEAGAAIVNDVTAFRLDPQMADVAAAGRAGVVLMHSRGSRSPPTSTPFTVKASSGRCCASWATRWPQLSRGESPRRPSVSTRGLGSRRPWNRTSNSSTGWPRCRRSPARCWWAPRASGSSG
jgi:hypothetical protein